MNKFITTCLLYASLFAGCDAGKNGQTSNPGSPQETEGKTYSYSDGSGNRYLVSRKSFEYIPIKPSESSSGTYSGGDPVKNQPGLELFRKFSDLIQAAYADKKEHTTERNKGTASIVMSEEKNSKAFIIKMGSSWIREIEIVLAKMKIGQ